ncbi:MAG: hypothetical protein HQL23_06315 [Candidatus Omnitrophica bacterium]|nr:hypothetical protein [Candidatus Omnitrophota bacterium]
MNKFMLAAFFLIGLLVSGCIQSKESLRLKEDGSGTVSVALDVPASTVVMMDQMMGAMAPKAADRQAGAKSVAQQIFGNQEEILKKAAAAGAKIEFLRFDKQTTPEGGISVRYELTFDRIDRLENAGVFLTSFEVSHAADGSWVLRLKEDEAKKRISPEQIKELETQQQSPTVSGQDAAMQQTVFGMLKGLDVEFSAAMPLPLKEATGFFVKASDQEGRARFTGELFQDAQAVKKLYENETPSRLVWGKEPAEAAQTAEPAPAQPAGEPATAAKPMVDASEAQPSESPSPAITGATGLTAVTEPSLNTMPSVAGTQAPALSRLHLKNGDIVEGKILERGVDFIRMNVLGVEMTYYNDEIERVE